MTSIDVFLALRCIQEAPRGRKHVKTRAIELPAKLWMSRDKKDKDVWREMPVAHQGVDTPQGTSVGLYKLIITGGLFM